MWLVISQQQLVYLILTHHSIGLYFRTSNQQRYLGQSISNTSVFLTQFRRSKHEVKFIYDIHQEKQINIISHLSYS